MVKMSMKKISEVLRQRIELQLKYRDIARSLSISVGTVSSYLYRAKAAGISWPLPNDITEQELYNKLFLPVSTQIKTQQLVLPVWEYIHQELRKKGVTLLLLWREYREQHKNGIGYSQFCNLYQQYSKKLSPIMRHKHKAGEKVFVDYSGMTIDWIAPNENILTAEIFVGSLGASQKIFAEATASQKLPDWIDSHIHMFEYFGGVTEMLIPDNLRSGVTKAHRYDPDINANYQHFSEHYGVAIVPARVASPRDKAIAEISVNIVEKQILAPLRNMTFTSLGEINQEIKKRLLVINNQKFQKMNTSREQLYNEIDKPALKPLPPARYQYAVWKKAKINVDYHFIFEDSYYSTPYQYIGKTIEIRATNKTVECFYDNHRIAMHARCYKKYCFTTLQEHMPLNHQEHKKFSPGMLKNWAMKIGKPTLLFVEHLMNARAFPQQAYRSCLGLLRLSNKYGELRLNKACHRALSVGASRYQQVEAILKNNLETVLDTHKTTPIILHDNIRGADYYK